MSWSYSWMLSRISTEQWCSPKEKRKKGGVYYYPGAGTSHITFVLFPRLLLLDTNSVLLRYWTELRYCLNVMKVLI